MNATLGAHTQIRNELMRTGIFLASAAGVLAASLTWAAEPPPPDRVFLAKQLSDLVSPQFKNGKKADLIVQSVEGARNVAIAFSCGLRCESPDLDERTFAASLNSGARTAIVESNATLVRTYAESLSADELASVLTFYRSAQGQAALKARAAVLEKVTGKQAQDSAIEMPLYKAAPAEAAFFATPAGVALKNAAERPEIKFSASDLLQLAVTATEADYCGKAHCDSSHRQLFKRMQIVFNPRRSHGEHAMFGDVAGDLFTKPSDASLARAACLGDSSGVDRALKAGAEINSEGGEGYGLGAGRTTVTPLIWAIDCNSPAGVTALLDAGADPNKADKFGATPVTLAAGIYDPAILKILLQRGGDPNAHTDRRTALEEAVNAAHGLERVQHVPRDQAWKNWQALIDAGADPLRVPQNGRPLVQTFIFEDDLDRAEQLIAGGWAGDPVDLGRTVETVEEIAARRGGSPSQEKLAAISRIKDQLRARGVRFPVGGLADLKKDSRGFYIQPQ